MHESSGLAYLRTFPDFEIGSATAGQTFGLERIEALLAEAGSPQLRLPTIHLAGTKGKGSTAAMLASILREAGYRTGLYTQPHLVHVHERFQIDGQHITDAELDAVLLEQVRPAVARLDGLGLGAVQQFEAQVALALLWFEARGVEVVVLETGLGGRLDGTNVVPRPLATVLTPIGHDHMRILGETLPLIAREKAGIIKTGVPAIAALQLPEAAEVFIEVCAARQAPLLLGGRDWNARTTAVTVDGTRFRLSIDSAALRAAQQDNAPEAMRTRETPAADAERVLLELVTPLLGAHQAINAGAAVVTALVVAPRLPRLDLDPIRRGLARVVWPGRLQIIGHRPLVVVDGAHTVESAAVLATAMGTLFGGRRLILVCGAQSDKDIAGVLRPLVHLAAIIIATQAPHPRAATAEMVAEALRELKARDVLIEPDPAIALQRAIALAAAGDVVLVAGSLYLVGAVLADWHGDSQTEAAP